MAESLAPGVRDAVVALERVATDDGEAAAFLAIAIYYGRQADMYTDTIPRLVAMHRPDRAQAAEDAEDFYDALFEATKRASLDLAEIMKKPRKPHLRLVKKNRRRRP